SDNYDTESELLTSLIVTNNLETENEGLYEYCYVAVDKAGNKSAMVCRLVEVGEPNPNGIRENSLETVVDLYPNPNTGRFVIDLKANSFNSLDIEIYNALGEKVMTVAQNVQGRQQFDVDLETMSHGVYFVRINTESEGISKRVVITR